MKKILLITAIVNCLLVSGSFTYAEPGSAAIYTMPNQTKQASGEIVMIDLVNNKLILKEASGEVSYGVGNHVKILINGKVLKLDQLKMGEKITVHYKMEQGGKLIVSIM